MKNKLNLSTVLSLTFIFLFTTLVAAQDFTQKDPRREIEMTAEEKVEKWDDLLSLRSKQESLMRQKFVEFDIKREKLRKEDLSEEERLNRLKDLKILETREMRNILTKPQYDRFLSIMEEEAEGTASSDSGQ